MANDEFRRIAGLVHDAGRYSDLFARSDGSALKTTFRSMTKVIHPDLVTDDLRAEAGDVMSKLTSFYDEAVKAVQDGTFGAPTPLLTLQTADFRHDCTTRRTRWADMTVAFDARSVSGAQSFGSLVKIARLPRDNDLLAAEADALRLLAKTGDEHHMYFPRLLDSTAVRDGRARLRANVLERLDGFYNLEEVMEHVPGGIHPLDMGWIWRRTLWALGGCHEAGVLHGALVPSHIMIEPTLHGVVLVDWCYSVVRSGDDYPSLSAVAHGYRDWYPDAILRRTSAPTAALDLALAARSMCRIMGSQPVPEPMRRYFTGVKSGATHGSAYELLARFDEVLERLGAPYWPRSYRPLNW